MKLFLVQMPQFMNLLSNDLSIVVKNNFHLNASKQAELLAKIKDFYFKNGTVTQQHVVNVRK